MDTPVGCFLRVFTGTLLVGGLVSGCGGSSDSGHVEPASVDTVTPTQTATATPTPTPRDTPDPVTAGARLFFQETFDGNGRTCGTCHPAENAFTLSPEFVASLSADDPLFVADNVPALAGLESSELLHGPRALILENIDGFDQPPVFRSVPHVSDVRQTRPFGWSGSFDFLDDLVRQAVRQHFPRTLNRIEGVDFRLPTDEETAAIVAFLESKTLQLDEPTVDFTPLLHTDAQLRGRDLFFTDGKCSTCHIGALLTTNIAIDTGLTRRPDNGVPVPGCVGDCPSLGALEDRAGVRCFSVPPLIGLKHSAPFFHDNSAATIREAVAHYTTPWFQDSQGGQLTGGIAMTEQQIDDVAAFLEALTFE